jgi:hypothetical protein
MSELELLALTPQRVDATLEIDVEPRAVIDRQGLLSRDVGVRGVCRMLQAPLVDFQEAREVNGWLGYRGLAQQGAVHAIFRAANSIVTERDSSHFIPILSDNARYLAARSSYVIWEIDRFVSANDSAGNDSTFEERIKANGDILNSHAAINYS